jgi:hypothetical protein
MEQLVARRAHNPKVVGSSPAPATNKSRLILSGFFYLLNFGFVKIGCRVGIGKNWRQQVLKKND